MTVRTDEGDMFGPRRFGAVRRADDAERLDLRGLLRVLKRRWLTIAGTAALVLGAVGAFALLTPPLYSAGTQILIDPRDRRVLQTEVTSNALGGDAALIESQVRLITSDTVLRRVVTALDLGNVDEFGRGRPGDTATPDARALQALTRRVNVRRADKTYVLDVRASSSNPEMAARIANAVAAAYLADQADAAQQTTRRATGALTSRLEELRDNLRAAENRAQAFRSSNSIVGAQGSTVTEQQLTELNQRLVLARARAAEAQARVDAVNRVVGRGGTVDPGSISDALASNVVTALRTQYAEISRRETELSNQLGPRHPSVVDVRSQAANLRRLISEELARIAESARTDLAVARAAEQSMSRDLDRLQTRTLETNQSQIRLRELEREVEAAKQLYEAFLTRSLQTSEQERMETVNARVIAQAVVPSSPSFPPRTLLLALGLVGGLGLGIATALLREHLDDTFRAAAQLRRAAGLDLLAAVPAVGGFASRWSGARGRGVGFDVIDRPASRFSAAIRTLRNELRDAPGRALERSVLVVSAEQGEGKTTIATNLALAAAAGGERVLLVDADMARRTLSRRIAPDATVGLTDVLAGRARLADVLVRDPRSGVMALPLAAGPASGAERPSRAELAMLLDAARPQFDYVVFDAGPVLADFGPRAIAEAVDQVVLVVHAGRTRRSEVLEAIQLLRAPDKIRGAVLNMADAKAATRYELR